MRQIIFIVACFFLCSKFVNSQTRIPDWAVEHESVNGDEGYYIKNSVLYTGVWFEKDNKNERAKRVIVPKQLNHESIVFYPEDIEEYGFITGIKYVSAKLNFNGNEKNVFLEEVININDSVFFYMYSAENKEDIFFILDKKKDNLRQIDANSPYEIWDIFKSLNDCSEVDGLEPFPRKLTRKRIFVFYSAYRDCNSNLFPWFQFGPVLNMGIGKAKTNETPKYVYPLTLALSAGGFFQIPFDECTSLRTEILYSYFNNKGNIDNMQKIESSSAQYLRHSVQMPLLVRYSFNFQPWKNVPYFELGPCFDYAFYGGKVIDGEKQKPIKGIIDNNSMVTFQYGYSIGAGLEHKISYKKSFYLGLRYNWFTGSRKDHVEKMQFIGINVAISL